MKKYIVYITHYIGNKLPPFYIGSSYEEKVLNGYNGTILSKKWGGIYKTEQKENKNLFKTRILSCHEIREEALEEELRLQKMHLVVKNNKYFNESYAQPNGFFGRDVSGENHPMYGKTHSEGTKNNWSLSRKSNKLTQETKDKISKSTKGISRKPLSQETKDKIANVKKGTKHSEETKIKMSNTHKGKKLSKETKDKISKVLSGKGNSQFKGYCIYNNKKFISTELALQLNISVPLINRMCKENTKIITQKSYVLNNFLKENYSKHVIGETWESLGFKFELKE